MTAEGCQQLIHQRVLISDIQLNGLAGGSTLPHYMITMKLNEKTGKALCYICPRKIGKNIYI